ncbi:PIN domain-containing protein [Acinetobacter nosocomialis]|uniref:PIN domain-containing protein n=1 Tax=Acinetobacter nosocomialis TaxID=106654 RepID=UPI001B825661|nr:PIN domain-containing protein [Acinetobacter nosocomialis]
MIVAIDTNVLVSLVNERATYINLETFLHQNNATLLIPTPVVAEFTAIDFSKRRNQFMSFQHKNVIISEFDQLSAFVCGEITSKLSKVHFKDNRQRTKIDLQIIAIALAKKANLLISNDKHIHDYLLDLGEEELKVCKLHEIKLNLRLFDFD